MEGLLSTGPTLSCFHASFQQMFSLPKLVWLVFVKMSFFLVGSYIKVDTGKGGGVVVS